VPLPVDTEADFQNWYRDLSRGFRLDPNPDDPRHMYDYRGAYLSNDLPTFQPEHQQYRWTDRYKRGGYEDIPDQPMGSRQLPDVFQGGEQRRQSSVADAIMAASAEHDVPASLIGKVLRLEGSSVGSVSPRGAVGPMQLMPQLVRSYGEDVEDVAQDPTKNISLGTRYLSELSNRFRGNEQKILAAYNAGPTRLADVLRRYGAAWPRYMPSETRNYLRRSQT
jgi:soluble lytic murein transglycosylase-like protein